MVFKVSKGGVRTGNTLRGLHSKRTKRYGRHACLLGNTSLGRRDLTRLISDGSDDNQMVKDTLAKTNVLLSLNKQRRWLLPAIIGQMIKQGNFNKGTVVSMLEKHKLKRRANCVNLISNNPRAPSIAPKQNKYFSFSLDSFTDNESNRQKRRTRANELVKLKKPKVKLTKRNGTYYQSIEAYTVEGSSVNDIKNSVAMLESDKPEYRLEVFYPCPQSCSLTYNPKYTDVTVAEGKTGKMEVQSNVKAQKKGLGTHRKRLTSRDINILQCEAIEEDVDKMWDECCDFEEGNETCKPSESCSMENSLQMLLAQAQKARDLCVRRKDSCHKKNKRKSKVPFDHNVQDKSHIVFIDRQCEEKKTMTENKRNDDNAPSLEYFRVILSTHESSPQELKSKYGSLYAEETCEPRRFVLDVTDDVANLLSSSKASTKDTDFSSYLVCVYDGFYDNGLAAYKVAFNSMALKRTLRQTEIVPFTRTSISDIMNAVASHLLDLNKKNQLEYVKRKSILNRQPNNSDLFLHSRIKLKINTLDTSHELSRMAISMEDENKIQDVTGDIRQLHDVLSMDFDEDAFCDVCYASVALSRIESVSGTKLKSCGHLLCDECWTSHFRTSIRDGKTEMSCGGYDCNTKVGPVTLMSLLHISEVTLLLQRKAEERVETMDNAKWCPYPDCGQVIVVDSTSKDLCVDVTCACGNKLCFSCLGPAHWPAKCDQAEEYLDKLPSIGPVKEYVEEKPNFTPPQPPVKKMTMSVEGRLCPRCNRFIEKFGGCSYMVCKCGFSMCWGCMKPYHSYPCKPDPCHVYDLTRILIVKHAAKRQVVTPEQLEERPKIEKNKQKASLYQRALQQRDEGTGTKYTNSYNKSLRIKMVQAAQRDLQFKMEIMNAFSASAFPEDDASLKNVDVTPYVRSLLKSSIEMKRELHHVTEFTFILIQGTPHSVAKQRILKLADDLSGFCSFVRSILDLQDKQDVKAAFRRLVNLQEWAKRGLDTLIWATSSLRAE